ncbi:helix-turn-helix domain-containing protein [Kocuria sp. JC486]|uniref:helix-turn-helix domain-containing protein n=1 Tax=Kocuria sp. JC486 TaxID=1970736 RepID=UPI00141F4402|nr:helix-turn-helix domain-containing protein [Kocuria sp. JC486]
MVEIKQVLERRDVGRVTDQSRSMTTSHTDVPVVAARYLTPSVREALAEQGLSYVDATGNIRVVIDAPAVFISESGEDRDPWRKGRPRGTLKGEPAARVTRALLDYRRDWSVRELVAASGSSTGAAYRVLDYLEREGLVVKKLTRYRVTDWERLLRAWSADAAFQTTTRTMAFIEPRGVESFLRNLAEDSTFPVAVTGSMAAREWATYAPAKAAYVYVSSIQEASEQWGLRPNAAAPNVILLEPKTVGDVPFVNTVRAEAGYPVAAPPHVAADLLNGPGREPAEGDYLIEWMKANEERWRRE